MDQIKSSEPLQFSFCTNRPSPIFETYRFFFARHSRTRDLRAFLISFFNVSLVIQWVSKRFFSCCRKIAEIHEKIYKKYFVWRFPWNRSYADWQVLAWVAIYPLFLVTWVEKMTCQVQKRWLSWEGKWPTFVFVLSRLEALDLCSAGHLQLTWPRTAGEWPLMQEPANRHMTDSTENVIQNNFYRFLVDFSDYARTAKNPLIDPLTRETMKKEIRNVRRSLVFIVTCEEKR